MCIKKILALNNLQWVTCHKIQPHQIKLNQTKPKAILVLKSSIGSN